MTQQDQTEVSDRVAPRPVSRPPVDPSTTRAFGRPDGVNIVFVHLKGSGGITDLGPNGATGDEVTRRMRAAFTDQQSAQELKDYLSAPAIKSQIQKVPAVERQIGHFGLRDGAGDLRTRRLQQVGLATYCDFVLRC